MTNERLQEPSSKDEMDIQALIERWAKGVREEYLAGFALNTTQKFTCVWS
jgi:hypothetical protein